MDWHDTPAVQIGPVFTGSGSRIARPLNVTPPSVLSRYASCHAAPFGMRSGVAATSAWYSDTATLSPRAATHG